MGQFGLLVCDSHAETPSSLPLPHWLLTASIAGTQHFEFLQVGLQESVLSLKPLAFK